jgi:hypothetical protein
MLIAGWSKTPGDMRQIEAGRAETKPRPRSDESKQRELSIPDTPENSGVRRAHFPTCAWLANRREAALTVEVDPCDLNCCLIPSKLVANCKIISIT